MWRKIDMQNNGDLDFVYDLEIMCRHAVDRSQGGLLEIDIWYFCTDEIRCYIANRSSNLRSLRLLMCDNVTEEGFVEGLVKLPLLEYLELSYCSLSGVSLKVADKSLKVAGKSCPNLKTLKINCYPGVFKFSDDDVALAIAESMPELRHLHLFANGLTNTGLNAILDACPHLEHLDLRYCFMVDFDGNMKKRCFERIKDLRQPFDSTDDYPFDVNSGCLVEEEQEEAVEVEEEEDNYSYGSDDYVYDIPGDVDNHSDTYDSCDD